MNIRLVIAARALLCLTALLTIEACGGNKGPVKGELVVWHWMTDREDALQALADQYSKEKGIKIRLELYAPSDAYASKVRAAVQTKTLPDIFGVLGESRDLASFVKSGHIANLAPMMAANNNEWQKTLFPKALATTSYEAGNQHNVPVGIYGVPIDVTNIQMLYNEALFEKAGLDPKKPPQTWDDFLASWHKLKAAGIPGLVSGWGETWLIECLANNFAFNVMGEKKVLDTYRGIVSYTDPDWIRVLTLFDTMRKEELLVSGVVTMNNKTAEQTFANGKAAFAFNGSWCVNVYKGMNPDLRFGAMFPPRVSNAHPMKIWGGAGSSLMVNANTPNRDEAIQFLRWLTEAPQQVTLSKDTLNLPANRQALKDLPDELASFASKMDETTHPSQWPVTENSTVTEAFDKGIQSILIGEKTPTQVAAEVQAYKKQQSRK
jgi:raffinose/stachyose/melibiose transport system substrate-binding protein